MIEISSVLEVKDHIHGLEGIVFDLDDTLYGEKEYVRSGYEKIAEAFPQIPNAAERLWGFFLEGKPAIDELLKQEKLSSEAFKQKILQIYRCQMPKIHLYEGVQEMLGGFRQQGRRLGIITDGRPEGQRAKIQALGLEQMVDHIIVTDELGGIEYRKPHPLAFQQMQEELGVPYERMCYVGDNIKKDFIAPQKLGMRGIHLINRDGLYQ